jgi:uncharacterized protein with FMN-binding domain
VKRAPIVIAGTVAGLVAVLEFHTTPAKLALAGSSSLPTATTRGAGTSNSSTGGSGTSGSSTSGSGTSGSGTSGSAGTSAPAASQSGSRTATGEAVNYNWGILSVKVTVSGGKITSVGLASLNDGDNPRSQSIDQQAIPILEQQALQAQSASIQGVSGASYTSEGFAESLQSALHSLGM